MIKLIFILFPAAILLSCASPKTHFIGNCTWENAMEMAQNKFKKHNKLSDHKIDMDENGETFQIIFSPKTLTSEDEQGNRVLHKGGGAKYVIAKKTCTIIKMEEYQ
ncbi:MAG: hypothetical protein DI538_08920 [Azospira oryzae]|nr:MAG: hypothetical protein DI538_08920 [Azospira oryzae]